MAFARKDKLQKLQLQKRQPPEMALQKWDPPGMAYFLSQTGITRIGSEHTRYNWRLTGTTEATLAGVEKGT